MLKCEICDSELRWNVDVNEDYALALLVCSDCLLFVVEKRDLRVANPDDLLDDWLWGDEP